jgi:hypothetical protein
MNSYLDKKLKNGIYTQSMYPILENSKDNVISTCEMMNTSCNETLTTIHNLLKRNVSMPEMIHIPQRRMKKVAAIRRPSFEIRNANGLLTSGAFSMFKTYVDKMKSTRSRKPQRPSLGLVKLPTLSKDDRKKIDKLPKLQLCKNKSSNDIFLTNVTKRPVLVPKINEQHVPSNSPKQSPKATTQYAEFIRKRQLSYHEISETYNRCNDDFKKSMTSLNYFKKKFDSCKQLASVSPENHELNFEMKNKQQEGVYLYNTKMEPGLYTFKNKFPKLAIDHVSKIKPGMAYIMRDTLIDRYNIEVNNHDLVKKKPMKKIPIPKPMYKSEPWEQQTSIKGLTIIIRNNIEKIKTRNKV